MGQRMAESGWRVKIAAKARSPSRRYGAGAGSGPVLLPGCRSRTHRFCREGSAVRVRHDRLGVVIGEGVIEAGLDDPLGKFRRCSCRQDAHTLFPQAEMAQDTLDHLRVVDERNDTHRVSTSRTHQGIRLPNPLDEFAPLGRGDTAGLMLRHIDDLHGLADGQRLLGGPFLTLPAHFVGVPTDVAHQLKALVRDVLGKRNIAPAFRADLIDRYRIAEGSAPVRSTGRRQRHVSS